MFSTSLVAKKLNVSESTLRNLVRRGRLPEPKKINGGATLLWSDEDIATAERFFAERRTSPDCFQCQP